MEERLVFYSTTALGISRSANSSRPSSLTSDVLATYFLMASMNYLLQKPALIPMMMT